ncbi:MAG: vWA domain-containing protein [Myxococcota bacterium]
MKKTTVAVFVLLSLGLFACQESKDAPEKAVMEEPAEEVEVPDRYVELLRAEETSEGEMAQEQPEGAAKAAAPTRQRPVAEKKAKKVKNEAIQGKLGAKSGSSPDGSGATAGIGDVEATGTGKSGSAKGFGGLGLSGSGRGGGGHGIGSMGGTGQGRSGTLVGSSKTYDRERNTESYKDYGVNEMTETAKDHLSTFAVDVDTGSYTIARRKLESGDKPPASSVRVEEFVNYFRYNYPEPKSGPFAVHLEAAPSPFHPDPKRKLMRVGVQGKRVDTGARKPVHLTFLVDVSGSMRRPDKLGLAKKSLQVLTNNLREGDTVALATYAGRTAKILDPTGIEQRGRILNAINSLTAGGSTAMNSGLELAYKLALKDYKKDHINRVIVLSDGDANVGPNSHSEILKRIRHFVDEGVTLSTIGFGMGNYNDTMMEQLANKGNGNYYYIDSMDEARKVFGEQVDGTLQVIAKDVKIQVDFNEDAVAAYRLVGYENRDIADKDFRNDKVDAGEIGAGHTVTALYELILKDSDADRLATVRVRHKKPDEATASEQAFEFVRSELEDDLQKASDDFQFAAAVAGFAELLRDSKYAKQLSYELVEEIAEGASRSDQADRQEFIALVRTAAR